MTSPSHLVLLVHGIRDIARWESEIAATLEAAGFKVALTNYGRMNLLEFLVPLSYFRNAALEKVWIQIQYAVMLHPGAKVSIIAHSFGTYIVTNILRRQFNLLVDRVIFCGSVVRYDFPFQQINGRFNSPVLNEVGTADPWPAIAEAVTSGYGSAGTYGFLTPGVKDRFHNGVGHGYFLDSRFCTKYWVPFLANGAVVLGSVPADNPPIWVKLISILKIKYLLGTLGVLLSVYVVLFLLWGPERYSYNFNSSESKFAYWNAGIEQLRRDIVKPCWMPSFLCNRFFLKLVPMRDFKTFSIFDSQLRDVVSCRNFRFPDEDGGTTKDPNLALGALGKTFSQCVMIGFDRNYQVSARAKAEQMTPIARPGKTAALLCECDAESVRQFQRELQ